MAALAPTLAERRRNERVAPGDTRWKANAVVRPGQHVVLVNISVGGALVDSGERIRPGARTELQLAGLGVKRSVTGRVDRCQVVRLDPVRYRGAIVFDDRIELGEASFGMSE